MSKTSGKLIVIDGIDGSGKATQTEILVEKLKSKNFDVRTLDFPQYKENFFGGMVRQYLDGKFGKATEVDPHLASILYALDRWESADKIKTWLNEEKIVILDRYYTSNLIHQAAKLNEEKADDFIKWLHQVEFKTLKIPEPNLVVYLHIEPEVAHDLISKRGDGHDGHDTIEHMQKAEKRCQYMAGKLGWNTVECSQDKKIRKIEDISQDIWDIVKVNLDN